ncbi:MAG: peptidylprolyl isomerase [Candidatus Aenigmatarchaeota archaeon]
MKIFLIVLLVLTIFVSGCTTQVENAGDDNMANRIATFDTNKGEFKIELLEDKAPVTTKNFIDLAEKGYYDGLIFHRVIPNFMIQGGDPNGDGTGGPGYQIDDEFYEGSTNIRGTISMANSGPNTSGSQFFINVVDNVYLDYDKEPLTSKHPVFGKVVEGMGVVDAISNAPTVGGSKPAENIVINKVTIS